MKPRSSKYKINPGFTDTYEVEAAKYELEDGYFNFYDSFSSTASIVFTIRADRVAIIELQQPPADPES